MKQRTEKIVRFECDFCGSRFPSAWGCKSHEMTCEKNMKTLIALEGALREIAETLEKDGRFPKTVPEIQNILKGAGK